MMTKDRWPNDDHLFTHNWATAEAGTTSTQIVDSNLPNINWKGATIHLWSGTDPYSNLTGTVSESGTGTLTIAVEGAICPYLCPTAGGYYYLFGALGALDAEKEWFYDASAGLLYFWAPGGIDPNTLDLRAKQRIYGFDLGSRSNVTIKEINLFACTINTNGASSNDILDGINAMYVSHFTTLPGPAPGPIVDHMGDTGIIIAGSDNTLK